MLFSEQDAIAAETGTIHLTYTKSHMLLTEYAFKHIFHHMKQTKFFQCLSDETRLRALLLFEEELDLCVCELSYALSLPQPKVSRHLAAMREAGIVQSRRKAQWVFYSLNSEMADWQKEIVIAAIRGNKHEPTAVTDRKRLADMKDRPDRNDAA